MMMNPIFRVTDASAGAGSTSGTGSTSGSTGTSATGTSLASTLGSSSMGKDQFLQLLVTQLQNQDPTQPMQNTEFVAQLAQFSSLEQLQNVNSNLTTGILLNQSVNNSLSTSLIGKTIEAQGNTLTYAQGDKPELSFKLSADANAKVDVVDANGKVVATIKADGLKAGQNKVTWDGMTSDGTAAPAGDYTFKVTATDTKGNAVTSSTLVQGRVTGVEFDNGATYLLVGSHKYQLSDVTQILEAGK